MNGNANGNGSADGGSTLVRRPTSQNTPQQGQQQGQGQQQSQPNGSSSPSPPKGQKSQSDQDKDDAEARQKATENLVQSWMDRLQLISVITTFFAAMESQMLSITTPSSGGFSTPGENITNAAFLGAMVFHVFAAVVSFLAAFVLVRFKLREAKKEERKAEKGQDPATAGQHPATGQRQGDEEKNTRAGSYHDGKGDNHSGGNGDGKPWSSDPRMVQTGPWRIDQPPLWLLERCNILCLWTSSIGFALAFIAIVSFGWANQVASIGIFGSACMGACILGATLVFINPGNGKSWFGITT